MEDLIRPNESDDDLGSGMPPWLPFFRHAVVRLATYKSDLDPSLRLIFGSVELLAPGRLPATTGRVESVRVRDPAGRVFFHRVAMGAREAVVWYLSASKGALATPRPSDWNPTEKDQSGAQILVGNPQQEPVWPDLALPLDPGSSAGLNGLGRSAPFIGAGAAPARLSRTLASPDPSVMKKLRDTEVVAFLTPRIHVDLTSYAEYPGGLALVVPDPIVGRVDMFVRPRPDGSPPSEDLVLHVHPRRGIRTTGVEATVTETRAGALVRHDHLSVPSDGLVVLSRRHSTAMAGYVLTDRVTGILRHQDPVPFIRGVSVRPSVANRLLNVEAATGESPRSRTETYANTHYVEDGTIEIGPGTERGALSRIRAAERQRQELATSIVHGQRWLDDPRAAREYLRQIIARARRRLWIADRYLGWRQINQFVLATRRTDLEIRLLTSRSMLSGTDPGTTPEVAPIDRTASFAAALAQLRENGFGNVQLLCAREEASELHDRFLVVDDEAWSCGTSLHAVGHSLSLVLRVPSPEPVISRLDGLIRRAIGADEVFGVASLETRVGDALGGDGA